MQTAFTLNISQTVNAKPRITCFVGGSHCIHVPLNQAYLICIHVPLNQAYLICVAVLYDETLACL